MWLNKFMIKFYTRKKFGGDCSLVSEVEGSILVESILLLTKPRTYHISVRNVPYFTKNFNMIAKSENFKVALRYKILRFSPTS